MSERWLPVVGFEGLYEVSDLGRVRSLDRQIRYERFHPRAQRVVATLRRYPGKLLAQGTTTGGYFLVMLGRGRPALIHRLVLEAFVGPRPSPQYESLHGDGDRKNNAATNLRWGTRIENVEDARRHGTMPIGDRHASSKLTANDIPVIRQLLQTHSAAEVAAQYGVSRGCISGIRDGLNWKHIAEVAA